MCPQPPSLHRTAPRTTRSSDARHPRLGRSRRPLQGFRDLPLEISTCPTLSQFPARPTHMEVPRYHRQLRQPGTPPRRTGLPEADPYGQGRLFGSLSAFDAGQVMTLRLLHPVADRPPSIVRATKHGRNHPGGLPYGRERAETPTPEGRHRTDRIFRQSIVDLGPKSRLLDLPKG